MGWASGSSLLDEIAKEVMPKVKPEERHELAKKLIDLFEGEDCDTIYECEQDDIQLAFREMYPDN